MRPSTLPPSPEADSFGRRAEPLSSNSEDQPRNPDTRKGAATSELVKIIWPPGGSGRIQEILSRSGCRRRYVVPRLRNRSCREAHGEAQEEADACTLLDACAGVEFQEQPANIRFEWCGEWHDHRPDIFVSGTDSRREFWECKKNYEAKKFDVRQRTIRLAELLQPLGITYRLVTTYDLTQRSFLENARFIRRRASIVVPPSYGSGVLRHLTQARLTTLGSLVDGAFDARKDWFASLIYWGYIRADLSAPLSRSTRVSIPISGDTPWVWQLFETSKSSA